MKRLEQIVYHTPYAAIVAPAIQSGLYLATFLLAGTYESEILPSYMSSRDELLGLMIVLTLTPAFLLAFVIVAQRRSMGFARELVASRVVSEAPEDWLRPLHPKALLLGALLGVTYGLGVNTAWEWLVNFPTIGAATRSIVVGQAVLWMIVGAVLSIRLNNAMAYNRLGRGVKANLLDTSAYGPFARSGMDDVLAVAVLLVLTTVQALDAQFRIGNYLGAMLVALPAAAFLFLLPMLGVRRRLIESRDEQLERIDRKIEGISSADTVATLQTLETLLQHRDRIRETRLWPINRSVGSRLAFYVIIPPLAWLGAAVVEVGVGRIFGSD